MFLKKIVNSFCWNGILPFFINPKAKDAFNPTTKEAVQDAPDQKTNWDRMDLGSKSPIGVKNWVLLLMLIICMFFALLKGCDVVIPWEEDKPEIEYIYSPSENDQE